MAGTRTIGAAPSSIAERVPDSVRAATFAFALLCIEAALAASIVDARFFRLLLLFAAVIGTALLFRFPLGSAFVLLGLTDFLFLPRFFAISVGGVEVTPFELVLAGLLVVAVLQPRRRAWGGATGSALAVFLLLVAISGVLALATERAAFDDVVSWGRPFGLLLFFYVVVRLFPAAEQRRKLMLGAAVIAAVAGAVAFLVSLGWSVGEVLKGDGTQIVREEEGVGGVDRVRLAGLSLGYALFWYAAVQVVSKQGLRRWGWTAVLAGIAIGIVVSFNRNMWLGLAIGLLMLIALGGPLLRRRFVLAIAVAVAGISLVTAVGGSNQSRVLEPVAQRATTILYPGDVAQEGSYQDRARETDAAWDTAEDNFIIGVGPGADFGVFTTEMVGTNTFVRVPQLYLHNQYIYLVLIGGVGAFVAFLAFLGIPLVQAFRRTPRDPSLMTCGVGIAMIMISAVVAIYFAVEDMTVVLALLTGVIVADGNDRAGATSPSDLS